MFNFSELLQVYLIPFVVAVVVGLVVIFYAARRGAEPTIDDIADQPEPSFAQTLNGQQDARYANDRPAGVDVNLGDTQKFHVNPPAHGVSVSPGGGIDIPLGDAAQGRSGFGNGTVPGAPGGGLNGSASPAAQLSILVVDDSAVPRAKLRKLFEGHGYLVETANDGRQALEAIGRSKFAVVITDLEMPNMDGIELIAAIQGSLETEDIPVIAITGHEEMQARVHNIQGLYGIFKKPWNDRDLLKRVGVLASLNT
jgi:CheY-like chemotaxis protein